MIFRGIVDEDVIQIQVPAVVADAFEDDEAIVVGAIECESIFIPVVHISDDGFHIGAAVDGTE